VKTASRSTPAKRLSSLVLRKDNAMPFISRTRASVLAYLLVTLADPPSVTAATVPDSEGGPLFSGNGSRPTSIFGPTQPILTQPRRTSVSRHHDALFDRIEL
jgi:hypothetical protein